MMDNKLHQLRHELDTLNADIEELQDKLCNIHAQIDSLIVQYVLNNIKRFCYSIDISRVCQGDFLSEDEYVYVYWLAERSATTDLADYIEHRRIRVVDGVYLDCRSYPWHFLGSLEDISKFIADTGIQYEVCDHTEESLKELAEDVREFSRVKAILMGQ